MADTPGGVEFAPPLDREVEFSPAQIGCSPCMLGGEIASSVVGVGGDSTTTSERQHGGRMQGREKSDFPRSCGHAPKHE